MAAGLGAAALPSLALTPSAPGVVGIPITGRPLTRRVYVCRLPARVTATALTHLHDCLRSAVADLELGQP